MYSASVASTVVFDRIETGWFGRNSFEVFQSASNDVFLAYATNTGDLAISQISADNENLTSAIGLSRDVGVQSQSFVGFLDLGDTQTAFVQESFGSGPEQVFNFENASGAMIGSITDADISTSWDRSEYFGTQDGRVIAFVPASLGGYAPIEGYFSQFDLASGSVVTLAYRDQFVRPGDPEVTGGGVGGSEFATDGAFVSLMHFGEMQEMRLRRTELDIAAGTVSDMSLFIASTMTTPVGISAEFFGSNRIADFYRDGNSQDFYVRVIDMTTGQFGSETLFWDDSGEYQLNGFEFFEGTSGDFWISWDQTDVVHAAHFDADGALLAHAEYVLEDYEYDLDIVNAGGALVAIWVADDPDEIEDNVLARTLLVDSGVPVAASSFELAVSPYDYVGAEGLGDGQFVVVSEDVTDTGALDDITELVATLYRIDGVAPPADLAPEFLFADEMAAGTLVFDFTTGEVVDFQIGGDFVDPEGEALSYALTSDLELTLSADGSRLTGPMPTTPGTHIVHIDATDPGGNTTRGSYTFEISPPDLAPDFLHADEMAAGTLVFDFVTGETMSFPVAGDFVDPEGEALSYTLTSDLGLSLTADGSRMFGTLPTTPGTHIVHIDATDPGGNTTRGSYTFEIAQAPEVVYPNNNALLRETGTMLLSAYLSSAAYKQTPIAEDSALQWVETAGAGTAYDWVVDNLVPLTVNDLPSLALEDDIVYPDFGFFGLEGGIYHSNNAAALLARSDDTLYISFRGTNDGVDVADWPTRAFHWIEFGGMMEAVKGYLATDDSIHHVHLTGHSLGAAMVGYAYADLVDTLPDDVTLRGVTFASPGVDELTPEPDDANIVNFVNALDPIRAAHLASDLWGHSYQISPVSADLGELVSADTWRAVISEHGMAAYQEVAEALWGEQLDVSDIEAKYFKAWLPLDVFDIASLFSDWDRVPRISVPLTSPSDGTYVAGEGDDIVLAGALATAWALTPDLTGAFGALGTAWNGLKHVHNALSTGYDPSLGTWSAFLSESAGLLKDAGLLSKGLGAAKVIYDIGIIALKGLNAFNYSDFVLGLDGDDYLNGLGGHDMLFGGEGDDHLLGYAGVDYLDGGPGDDILDGTDYGKIVPGWSQDTLIGGTGNDTFLIDGKNDKVMESGDEGFDHVISTITYTLGANVERLTLIDSDWALAKARNGTGNALDNVLTGGYKGNTLLGLGGDDTLEGGVGADILKGGAGRDTFVTRLADVTGKELINGGGGFDTMFLIGSQSLSAKARITSIEAFAFQHMPDTDVTTIKVSSNLFAPGQKSNFAHGLTLTGDATSSDILRVKLAGKDGFNGRSLTFKDWGDDDRLDIAGSTKANVIKGSSRTDRVQGGKGDDVIKGLGGDDRLDGGKHNDKLVGGDGADTFVFGKSNKDRIMDFADDVDTIELDDALWKGWAGEHTIEDVLNHYGTVTQTGVVLDFGKHELTIRHLASLDVLIDDIAVV